MNARQLVLIFSPLAFVVVSAWVAFRRLLWFRGFTFLVVGVLMMTYHYTQESDSYVADKWQAQLDHVAGLWLATTILLLYAHFRNQIVELALEAVILSGALVLVFLEQEDEQVYCVIYVLATTLPPVVVTWAVNGVPEVRVVWVVAGTVLCAAGGVLYFIEENVTKADQTAQDQWLHSGMHVALALGAACVAYGARDPELLPDYHICKDLCMRPGWRN